MGNGPSALHQAVLAGDLTAVRVAVQQQPGSLDDTEPTNGWTPLHISAAKGYDVIARELLARGAAPNLVDKLGRTALHLAAAEGHSALLKDLLRKGADPTQRDSSGKTALDAALEKQQGPAAGVLAEALAGRGVAASTTPTGSPTAWQARAQQQQQQAQPAAPDLGGLHIGSSGQPGGGGGAYPSVPQPADAGAWLRQLPNPPGVSIAAPSAPPAPTDVAASAPPPYAPPPYALPPNAPPPNAPLPDYYEYLMPSTTAQLPQQQHAPGAPPLQAEAPPFSPYPAVPGAPAASQHAQPGMQPPQQQQQWPVIAPPVAAQQQHQQRVGDAPAAVPAVAGVPAHQVELAADDEDDDWGVSHAEDDWGSDGGRPSAVTPAAIPSHQQRQQQPDLVGVAVSGAGKVAGAVASTAVAGAKQLLAGLIPRPPGKDGSPLARVPGPEDAGLLANLPGATTAGPPGRLYSYEDLARATQGFAASNKLGAGGYGPVFRGTLDGVPVAVKLLDTSGRGSQGVPEFQAEVGILSRLHHPHIVLLMGCCPARCALVYELMDNGSLEQQLFNPALPELAWQDRIRIACEVVSALLFLHSAPEPIVHMDLKPGNLLLNKSLVCKVGDVGLSRLMPLLGGGASGDGGSGPVSTVLDNRLVGTPSYMDPEYLRTGRYGPKSDTYSLGVILLQMLTGLQAGRVVAVVEAALARSQGDAASFAGVIDPRSGSWPVTEAASFAHLGMRCVELSRASRPDLRGEVLPALLRLAERARMYEAPAALKRAASIGGAANPPSMFICPITQDVMEDPVFAADGYTYEREAIAGWVATHSTSPMTNLPLGHSGLTPNLGLRSAIREWQEKHGVRR